MSIVTEIKRVLDLPEAEAKAEARSKLCETILVVNGVPSYVTLIEAGVMVAHLGASRAVELASVDVKSIEPWVPKTGIYQHPTLGPLFVQKIPLRQWKRSFNSGLYSVQTLKGKVIGDFIFTSLGIDPESRVDFYKDKDGVIYYHMKKVGFFESDNTVVCTFPAIEQEMRAWLT
jgi:hypothetical protein